MMIDPETYYEMSLKGKNEKEIRSAIRALKNEMGRLKNVMEEPDYAPELCPSESTRLWCTRLYLERAKKALMDAGGTYTASKAELKASNFDDSIKYISKLTFSIGGFSYGYETRTFTFEKGETYLSFQHSPLTDETDGRSLFCSKREFLEGIERLHLGEWETRYYDFSVLDGTSWDLKIEFNNGHRTFKCSGSNGYPYNFDELQDALGFSCELCELI